MEQRQTRPQPDVARPAPAQDLSDSISERVREHAQENEERAARAAAERGAAAQTQEALDDLEAEIDALLSENSEEFVIRFIQTEGQ